MTNTEILNKINEEYSKLSDENKVSSKTTTASGRIIAALIDLCNNMDEQIQDLQSEVKQLWLECGKVKPECKYDNYY